jgi:hypothetical protein
VLAGEPQVFDPIVAEALASTENREYSSATHRSALTSVLTMVLLPNDTRVLAWADAGVWFEEVPK